MLKKFFLNTLSSFVGAWIALVLFGVVAVVVSLGLLAKIGIGESQANISINKGSVLTLDLSGSIIEREIPESPNYYNLVMNDAPQGQTLLMLKRAIAAAKENKNIVGIYLKCGGVSASPATLNALRNALLDFKESGKNIIAYSESYTMGDYYIATVADKVCLNPFGTVSIKGIGGTVLYFKGLLDKIGINIQVVKVGTYKSAVEPYILPEMSRPARAQLDTLYGNMWGIIKSGISKQRSFKSPSFLDTLISRDFIFLDEGQACLENKLVDKLMYERQMNEFIAEEFGVNKKKLNFVSPSILVSQEDFMTGIGSNNQIAVLFACGEIIDGGGNSVIDYNKLVPIIVSLADDDKVKGMVLRVNSPGGSVFGSEQIGEALDYFQSKGKTLAVSMGDYAASGGYWISSCADHIFADRLTITGSIGIFGLIPDISPLLEKIGVSPQLVSTNPESAFPGLLEPMTPVQYAAMQKNVEKGYDKFVARVAKGRHLSEERVRQIGEGRVWDAVKAKEIGLIDEFGSLEDAIEWVAEKESLQNYGEVFFPIVESTIWNFINQLGGASFDAFLKEKLGESYNFRLASKLYLMIYKSGSLAKIPEMTVGFTDDNFHLP